MFVFIKIQPKDSTSVVLINVANIAYMSENSGRVVIQTTAGPDEFFTTETTLNELMSQIPQN